MSTGINHEVVVTELGDRRASIHIDGHELTGVVAYKIERELEPLQRVTFTVLAKKVRVVGNQIQASPRVGVLAIAFDSDMGEMNFYAMLSGEDPFFLHTCDYYGEDRRIYEAIRKAEDIGINTVVCDPLYQGASWYKIFKEQELEIIHFKCTKPNLAPYNPPDYTPETIGPIMCRAIMEPAT